MPIGKEIFASNVFKKSSTASGKSVLKSKGRVLEEIMGKKKGEEIDREEGRVDLKLTKNN